MECEDNLLSMMQKYVNVSASLDFYGIGFLLVSANLVLAKA